MFNTSLTDSEVSKQRQKAAETSSRTGSHREIILARS
jgi:hypothetical protein